MEPRKAAATLPEGRGPLLLVSVRSAAEAASATDGGADVVDVKEPARGSLGRASDDVIRDVIHHAVPRRVPVTAALGELREHASPNELAAVPGVVLWKLGLSGCSTADLDPWIDRLEDLGADLAAVAYADHEAARAPAPRDVLEHAARRGLRYFLVDTFDKRSGPLSAHLGAQELAELAAGARASGIRFAVAGSLRAEDAEPLLAVRPDVIAVRGAACQGGDRLLAVEEERVRRLRSLLDSLPTGPALSSRSWTRGSRPASPPG